jgi:hypothetical protein
VRNVALAVVLIASPATAADAIAATQRQELTFSLVVTPLANDAGGGICAVVPRRSAPVRITSPQPDADPAWSPDGSTLAFSRRAELVVLGKSGRAEKIFDFGNRNEQPSWSPDGRWIAFAYGAYGSTIAVIRPAGTGKRDVVPGHWMVFNDDPAWSPDGKTIAFVRHVAKEGAAEGPDVYLVDPSGRDPRRLVSKATQPAWSPDGRWLAFRRESLGTEIGLVRADGRDEHLLTATAAQESDPAWSPDGKWIAFERRDAGDRGDIVVMRRDGSDSFVAAGSAYEERDPAWRRTTSRSRQRPCVFRGSSRADRIRGTPFGDVIAGGGGRDVIWGEGGSDKVDAGAGPDIVAGGSGNDRLLGGSGRDRLLGGTGADHIAAGDRESDVVDGGPGVDAAWFDAIDRVFGIDRFCDTESC